VVGPSWSITGNLNTGRDGHSATLLPDGKVLVAGASSGGNTSELYDPATGVWSYTGNLNNGHLLHTATLLPNGKVLVAAGFSNSAELYDSATGTWSMTGNLTP
jgi:WD40 repeat protein